MNKIKVKQISINSQTVNTWDKADQILKQLAKDIDEYEIRKVRYSVTFMDNFEYKNTYNLKKHDIILGNIARDFWNYIVYNAGLKKYTDTKSKKEYLEFLEFYDVRDSFHKMLQVYDIPYSNSNVLDTPLRHL